VLGVVCAPGSVDASAEGRRLERARYEHNGRQVGHEQVDVVVLSVHPGQPAAEVATHAGELLAKGAQVRVSQYPAPTLGHEDQLHLQCNGFNGGRRLLVA
jgi:hypothetical protein